MPNVMIRVKDDGALLFYIAKKDQEEEIASVEKDCEPLCPTHSIKPFKGVYKIEADTCTECEGEFDVPQCLDVCMEDDCIIAA